MSSSRALALAAVADAVGFLGLGHGLAALQVLPLRVVRVELGQHEDQLVQHAHGEGAGAAGRVQHLEPVDGCDERRGLGRVEAVRLVAVGQQAAQARLTPNPSGLVVLVIAPEPDPKGLGRCTNAVSR